MKKTRVLAIAPYEGLRELLQNAASQRDDVELTVRIGDLQAGVDIVQSMSLSQYDVILSRGGTAKLIRQTSLLPVAEIRLSIYDMLSVIRLAQSYMGRIAVVGFPAVTQRLDVVFDMMNIKFRIYTINDAGEVDVLMSEISKQGYTLIVGDAVAVRIAKANELNGILITSGPESVQEALTEAVLLHQATQTASRNMHLLSAALNHSDMSVLACAADGRVIYSNLSVDQQNYPGIFKKLTHDVSRVLSESHYTCIRRSKDSFFHVEGHCILTNEEKLALFVVHRMIDMGSWRSLYTIEDDNPSNEPGSPPLDNIGAMSDVLSVARKYAISGLPVILLGEVGTDADSLARYIHQNSPLKNRLLITLDCNILTKKQFASLLSSERSPLSENGMTIYIKSFDVLEAPLQHNLMSFIYATSLYQRCRVIFSSYSTIENCQSLSETLMSNRNAPVTLTIPSLRTRQEDIASLASLYINHYNFLLGKQVVGFEDEAIKLLRTFSWPYNTAQFTRVLRQLVLTSRQQILSFDHTQQILSKEPGLVLTPPRSMTLEGSLDDIIRAVIEQVLAEEDMNQSRAAKRLGISRTTLWRKLQN